MAFCGRAVHVNYKHRVLLIIFGKKKLMVAIFISHAVKDKHLAEKLVELLKEGIGVPETAIFCSSLDGHSIPFGEDFNDYMKSEIQKPQLVILLMTPAYMESYFCLMELGAAWSRSHKALPIIVPPIDFGTVTKTLGFKQAWDITKHSGLIDLRKTVCASIEVEHRDDHTWEKKRITWKSALKTALNKLAGPSHVAADAHEEALEAIKEQANEISSLQELLEEEKEKSEALAKAKDAEEVKTILSGFDDGNNLEEQLEALLEEVLDARPKRISDVVFKHIIMDHFGKSAAIDWFSEKEEFETAIKYSLISQDEGYPVDWSRSKLKPLRKAISHVQDFLNLHPASELRVVYGDAPLDADDLEFWEHHFNI